MLVPSVLYFEFSTIAPCSSLLSVGRVPMFNLLHKWNRQGSEALVASHAYRVTSTQCLLREQQPFPPDEVREGGKEGGREERDGGEHE